MLSIRRDTSAPQSDVPLKNEKGEVLKDGLGGTRYWCRRGIDKMGYKARIEAVKENDSGGTTIDLLIEGRFYNAYQDPEQIKRLKAENKL